MLPSPVLSAAREVFAYLSATEPLPAEPVDAIIGFGMFDLRLPVFCGKIQAQGHAPRIIFTGGIGAGTGDLGQPEADAWRDALFHAYPDFPHDHLIVENRSTNTAENIAYTAALLERDHPTLVFGRGLQTALVVASPSRMRRVKLTLQHLQPALRVIRCLPRTTSFDREHALYTAQGQDYLAHLAGELDRIVSYPARGWIAAEPLPDAIAAAHATLTQAS
jgi:uncharacterized SAM-binding protein YcdF (DUF218 family)